MTEKLKCGCIPGEFLCPEAERLWEEVNRAYRDAKLSGNYAGYEQVRENYKKHFKVQKEV